MCGVRANAGMRRVIDEAIDPVLRPRGFQRSGRRHVWVRGADGLNHVIVIIHRRRWYDIQWGVLAKGAAEVVWDTASNLTDVSQAVLSGTPGNIRHPAPGQSWTLEDLTPGPQASQTIEAVRADLEVVADHLVVFANRRQLRDYLLLNLDQVDQRFVVPANLPMKLLVAATLAALDHDAAACGLLNSVEVVLAPYGDRLNRGRVSRLRGLCEGLCSPETE